VPEIILFELWTKDYGFIAVMTNDKWFIWYNSQWLDWNNIINTVLGLG